MFDFLIYLVFSFVFVFLIITYYKASNKVYDGEIVVSVSEDGVKRFSLELNGDPNEIETKLSVTFKVVSTKTLTDIPIDR